MAETTEISWADATFNPWIGCTRVSPGCEHCYAEQLDRRWGGGHWGAGVPRRRTSDANWRAPLRWDRKARESGKPFRVFCASLADVFDNEVPHEWRRDLFELIAATPALTWMLLTKRIGNANAMLAQVMEELSHGLTEWGDPVWPNVWIGATVVNQEEADRDIPKLLGVPARVRWLSCEPLLGPITLPGFDCRSSWCPICREIVRDTLAQPHELSHGAFGLGTTFDPARHCIDVPALLNWVIVGGESGHRARPMNAEWATSLRDQCAAALVPFHFKQWGEFDARGVRVGKRGAGHLLEGREHREFPRG